MKIKLLALVPVILFTGCADVIEKYISYEELDTLQIRKDQKAFVIAGDSVYNLEKWMRTNDSLLIYSDTTILSDTALTEWKGREVLQSVKLEEALAGSINNKMHPKNLYANTVRFKQYIPAERVDSINIKTFINLMRGGLDIQWNSGEITPSVFMTIQTHNFRYNLIFPTAVVWNKSNSDCYVSYSAIAEMGYAYGIGFMFSGKETSVIAGILFGAPLVLMNSEYHFLINPPGPASDYPLSASLFARTKTDIFDSWWRYMPGGGVQLEYNFPEGETNFGKALALRFGIEKPWYVKKRINEEKFRYFGSIQYAFN